MSMKSILHGIEEAEARYGDAFVERMFEIYPSLIDFDKETGEVGLFKECLDTIWDSLPHRLRKPLMVGTLMLRAMNNPDDPGAVVLHAAKEYNPHK